MDIDKVFETIEATKEPTLQRQLIINYCTSFVGMLETDLEARQDIAFNIASLADTQYAMTLKEEDSLSATLTFAGELEETDPEDGDWELLVEIIKSLE